MILSSVSETLASVSRHPALESAMASLRRGNARERIAGLTGTAKALLAAIVATELRRPMVVLVESGARAEIFAASMQFFYTALAGQEATQVAVLPAMDVLPWQEAAPHAEILENRAVTLWRYATGQARVVVAPVTAARMRLADAAYYAEQARTLARDESVSLDDLVAHLRRVGYESHDMVEMPGQFTVRGGIVDIFPAEAERPVRLELFGDSVESLREFDPNTQRSVRPIEHVTLPPLVEQPANGFGEGYGNSAGAEGAVRAHSLFDLREDTVVLLDEPGAIEEASRAFLESAMEDLESKKSDSLEAMSSYYFTGEWGA
jgi:transcription-repair coupling factor (superfamily II helicase)